MNNTASFPGSVGPLLYDSHTHTPLCGHAEGLPGDYAAAAFERGLRGLVVTCHCPMPPEFIHQGRIPRDDLDQYLEMISHAAGEWRGRVEILAGLESDWFPGMERWLEKIHRRARFDFILGSIHCGMPNYRDRFGSGDDRSFQARYFEHLAQAAESGLFDCLAHPDIVKNLFPGRWDPEALAPVIERCLDRVAAAGVAIELNTHLENRSVKEWCPGPRFLAMAAERGIPAVLGSDAHEPAGVGLDFPAALSAMSAAGYRSVSAFRARRRTGIDIGPALASLRRETPVTGPSVRP